jgi:hypothetical protein
MYPAHINAAANHAVNSLNPATTFLNGLVRTASKRKKLHMDYVNIAKAGICCIAMLVSANFAQTLGYGTVRVDAQNKLLPRTTPDNLAYDKMLDAAWTNFLGQPASYNGKQMYYFYCGFANNNQNSTDTWCNDPGEKLPNLYESARLYYAYTGDSRPIDNITAYAEYYRTHGTTPSTYSWPNFPQTGANAGATNFTGFTTRFNTNDVQTDLAADVAMTYFRIYAYSGNTAFRDAAINAANTLVGKMRTGNATQSPWPYVVNTNTNNIVSQYCSNYFFGAMQLFDDLIDANIGNVSGYSTARTSLKNWLLQYPMQSGNWVDGHSDNNIGNTMNKSHTVATNAALYLLINPSVDPNFVTDIPRLLQWSEDNMMCTCPGPANYYGAHVAAEQDCYKNQMGYQTARLAAVYALWYMTSNSAADKDIALRGINYQTYMVDNSGKARDGASDGVGWWWGDSYGEATRMMYLVYSAMPELSPAREDHILYSRDVLKAVSYTTGKVKYTATGSSGTEYLRLSFKPSSIALNSSALSLRTDLANEGYTQKDLGGGDYAVSIRRTHSGDVVVSGPTSAVNPALKPTTGREALQMDGAMVFNIKGQHAAAISDAFSPGNTAFLSKTGSGVFLAITSSGKFLLVAKDNHSL